MANQYKSKIIYDGQTLIEGTPVWSLHPTQGKEEATDPTGKEPAPRRGLWEKYMAPIKLIDHTSM